MCKQFNSIWFSSANSRSSHWRCSVKKGVLRNFAKFTGKHLSQSLFFNKVAGLRPAKKETLAQVFSCEFCEISKNTFSTEHLRTTASEILEEHNILVTKLLHQVFVRKLFISKQIESKSNDLNIKLGS